MPLASAKKTAPVVTKPAVVTKVGDGKVVNDTREASRVDGQCRTHIIEAAFPSLMSTIDLMDEKQVQSLFDKGLKYIKTGVYAT